MSNATFKAALDDVVIAGVRRKESIVGTDVSPADLPYQYVRLPQTDVTEWTFSRVPLLKTRTLQLVVVVRPIVQGTNIENHDDMITMADSVETALTGAITNVAIEQYSLALETVDIGATSYHAVVVTVTGRDK